MAFSSWYPSRRAYGSSYTRYGSQYGRYSRYRRSSRSRATGNQIAARQQKDSATVTINRIASYQIVIPSQESGNTVAINHWNSLRLSSYYSNYSPMYDQMKIDKIRVKLTGSRLATAVLEGAAGFSPAVVMAFDRNGLDETQIGVQAQGSKLNKLTPTSVSTYSSAQIKNWSAGNAFVMYQTIYPSTISEKGQWISTTSLSDPESVDKTTNPCTLSTDPTVPFKPITLIALDMAGGKVAAEQTYGFQIEFEYVVTFRGMRKPSLNSNS